MDTVLPVEEAVSILTFNHDGGGLDAGLVPLLIVHDFVGEPVALGPPGIHAVEHLGPILGLRAASAGVEGQNGIGGIVFPGQQRLQPGGFHALNQRVVLLFQFGQEGLVLLLVAHFAQDHHVLPRGTALGLGLQLTFELLELLQHPLRLFRVVPKAVGSTLSFQKVHFLGSAVQVKGFFQLIQLRTKII